MTTKEGLDISAKNGAAAPRQTRMEEMVHYQRDLSFPLVRNDHPQAISPAQIDFYNDNGYLLPFDIFDEREIADHRVQFDDLLARVQACGESSYSINGYHSKCAGIYDLCVEPRIVRIVKDILGDDLICWGTHYFCKMPGEGKQVAWHQDATYWPFDKSRTVTVWLAIDDADRANGAMKVIPGSHRLGPMTSKASEASDQNVLADVVPDAEAYGEPVYFELRGGQASVHTDMLLHGSEPNSSDRRRCGLTIRYCTPDVRSLEDYHHGAILVSGSDPENRWPHTARPEGDGF